MNETLCETLLPKNGLRKLASTSFRGVVSEEKWDAVLRTLTRNVYSIMASAKYSPCWHGITRTRSSLFIFVRATFSGHSLFH